MDNIVSYEKTNCAIDESIFTIKSWDIPVPPSHPHYFHLEEKKTWRLSNDYSWRKALKESKKVRGIMFLGCSFTWGQGLYYYSNLDSLREPMYCRYDSLLLRPSHVKYMESVRFSRTVSNHFNAFEMVIPGNGGTNQTAIKWCINDLFENPNESHYMAQHAPCEFGDFSHIIFQMTEWTRKRVYITVDGVQHEILNTNHRHDKKLVPIFNKFLAENNITLEEFEQFLVKINVQDVKDFLQFIESKGIKTYLMVWPDEYIPFIQNDEFLSSRFITFSYKENNFNSIRELMDKHPEMVIMTDYEEFIETPKDMHPSLKCHRVIADAVINKIENYG